MNDDEVKAVAHRITAAWLDMMLLTEAIPFTPGPRTEGRIRAKIQEIADSLRTDDGEYAAAWETLHSTEQEQR